MSGVTMNDDATSLILITLFPKRVPDIHLAYIIALIRIRAEQ
jgi:hypothetical protein